MLVLIDLYYRSLPPPFPNFFKINIFFQSLHTKYSFAIWPQVIYRYMSFNCYQANHCMINSS